MKEIHYISSDHLNLSKLNDIVSTNIPIALSENSREKITNCRDFLDSKVSNNEKPIYGINTGFERCIM